MTRLLKMNTWYRRLFFPVVLSIALFYPVVEFILDFQRGNEKVSVIYVYSSRPFAARVTNGKILNKFDSQECCASTIEILGNCAVLYIDDIEFWRRNCVYLPIGKGG